MKNGKPSWTARWVATQRAGLHERRPARGDADAERRLYRDLSIPFLRWKLADPAGMATRTRFIDERVLNAIDRGVAQIVLLGAGYDGGALRFRDAPVKWIEVDHPATQADKIHRLVRVGAPMDHMTFVPIDLLSGDVFSELDNAGHNSAESTMWICEGLFPYLPRPTTEQLCSVLRRRSAPGSTLVCNVLVRGDARAGGRLVRSGVDRVLAAMGERRLAEFAPGDAQAFLRDSGWSIDVEDSTSPSRSDHTYMVAISASPSDFPRGDSHAGDGSDGG
ncbi:MAG TPA: SAM-dependent methyltransferase [Acidimicrobiales bacterium]|nr:SAM-dependent methyltransferase [Acidimicrobiales bacterium]